MSVKLEAGQWYRRRDGEIRYCVGESIAFCSQPERFVVENSCGQRMTYSQDGTGTHNEYLHLIEHLPDCTGFDWEPPKPQPAYRPFKNAEEFKPHRDFWVKYKVSDVNRHIGVRSYSNEGIGIALTYMTYEKAFKELTFEDGTPFGVRVDD